MSRSAAASAGSFVNVKGRLAINLCPIGRSGGGYQNAASFLASADLGQAVVLLREDWMLVDLSKSAGGGVASFRGGILARLKFELLSAGKLCKGAVCFTLFGPGLAFSKGRVINVVGCAYSNLFYPEIDFWQEFSLLGRIRRAVVDWLRKKAIARADYWIFETDAVARRAREMFSFPTDRTFIVKMAPSKMIERKGRGSRDLGDLLGDGRFNLLYLAGAHPNKRIDRLIKVAELLRDGSDRRFRFVLTFGCDSRYALDVRDAIVSRGLEAYFLNLGNVAADEVGDLIAHCHAMCNLARLESFSNNFVEAWAAEVPLIVTDADWSRESCGSGALYVDPEQPEQLVQALNVLATSELVRNELVSRGRSVLATLPTAEDKAAKYLEIVNRSNLSTYRGPSVWGRSRK